MVAIVVGILVGYAVRWGARGRGGWVYQALAVLLTYGSIVVTYIPPVVRGFREQEAEEFSKKRDDSSHEIAKIVITREATIELGGASASLDEVRTEFARLKGIGGVVWYHRRGAPDTPAPLVADEVCNAAEEMGLSIQPFKDEEFQQPAFFWNSWNELPVAAKLLLGAALFGYALVLPFAMLPDNLMGLLIIAFGVWQAWRLNRRIEISVTGPYQLAPSIAAAAPPGGPQVG